MPLTLKAAKPFAPFLDTRAVLHPAGAAKGAPAELLVGVGASNPYAENVGGAARAESWYVWLTCGDGRNGLARGTLVTFPDRPDIPCLYVQKCQRHGGLFCATCTANERPSA